MKLYMYIMKNFSFDFKDTASPLMEGIIGLHHHIFFFLLVIMILVVYLLLVILLDFFSILNFNLFINFVKRQNLFILSNIYKLNNNKKLLKKFVHDSNIEIVWTILPAFILILIAIPSFALLYSMDEIMYPTLTVKVLGHQWYWSYELGDLLYYNNELEIDYESYMTFEDDLDLIYNYRLLETDYSLFLPIRNQIRILIGSTDVLHSWAVPSLGIKLDAVPGRLNQCSIMIKRSGIFYGQCSEICGVNHGFMPIVIKAINFEDFNCLLSDFFFEEE